MTTNMAGKLTYQPVQPSFCSQVLWARNTFAEQCRNPLEIDHGDLEFSIKMIVPRVSTNDPALHARIAPRETTLRGVPTFTPRALSF